MSTTIYHVPLSASSSSDSLDHDRATESKSAAAEYDDQGPSSAEELGAQATELPAGNQVQEPVVIHARAYQLEMFEESLKRNIIVAMDTGSGKTQVAVLRIQAELAKPPSDKIIWFLVPTVALCEQQFRVLKSQIPAAQIKMLSGGDNIDTWTDTRIWDDYLKNVQIVISTYQVLLDAVSHAFVRLDRLSLIVFDEASPVMRSRLDAIEIIEQTLDAVCKSPNVHREELIAAVKRPSLTCSLYSRLEDIPVAKSLKSLESVFHGLDIFQDPYVIRLRAQHDERSLAKLKKAVVEKNTYVSKQMQSLRHRCAEIQQELGPWASEYFLYTAITRFLDSVHRNDSWFETWQTAEKQYLAQALQKVEITPPGPFDEAHTQISDKVTSLIQELSSSTDDTIGIIFVREVATVAVLAQMLSEHALTKHRFRIGTMVGTSNYHGKKRDLGGLDRGNGCLDLEGFREGRLNLLIATSVLEEGIDVPACNLVCCFDRPANLKSFIQRRGRARMQNSRLVLLMEGYSEQHTEWMSLEEEMKKRYEDDMRQVQELAELEESEPPYVSPLYFPRTGAQLDFDQAKAHLEHFCNVISSWKYADSRPFYLLQKTEVSQKSPPQVRATVLLPPSLPPKLRRIDGNGSWYSEKNATKDAAFQAFSALYEAGFVNDNLMPLIDDILEGVESRASKLEVVEAWNPWHRIAQAWHDPKELQQRSICLRDGQNDVLCEFDATLPCSFPKVPHFEVFWDKANTWAVETSGVNIVSTQDLKPDQSMTLIDLAYGHRWVVEDSQHTLHLQSNEEVPFGQLLGNRRIERPPVDCNTLVRIHFPSVATTSRQKDLSGKRASPFYFKDWLPSLDETQEVSLDVRDEPFGVPWLGLENWQRRQDFLHPVHEDASAAVSTKSYQTIWPAHLCSMDTIDVSKVRFGALIPSIMHMIEVYLVAHELSNTVLKELAFADVSLVVTAISSPAAHEVSNYQRYEFLGDSILKMLATASVTVTYPEEPEGYLSARKDRIVSNSRLCRSAVDTGLDKFILTKSFTGAKWRPLYVKDLLERSPTGTKRELSTKTLADVVESLIGAAYLDGGISKALACVRLFAPEVKWHSLENACVTLFEHREVITQLPVVLAPLERLIGYSFRNKNLLVEASTHASYSLHTLTEACMERLEFLGDAVLDTIVVNTLWSHERELSHQEMHLLRTGSVNADLLGFLMMEWTTPQEVTSISKDKTTIEAQANVPFWKFMRHASPEVSGLQKSTEERHAAEREGILQALQHGSEYPWALLAHLHIPKFFSDYFESLLGAVWVDSGSLDACREIVERAGILPCLRRILADNVDVLHPKSHLGQLAGREKKTVKYEPDVRVEGGSKKLFCKIFVDGMLVVEVGDGVSLEEVQTKAADAAYKLLRDSRGHEDDVDVIMTE